MWSVIIWAIVEALPGGGGSHVTRLNFKRLVSVFLNTCCLLLALLSLWQFGRGRLSLVARCCYLFGHVACQNLPWQGLIVVLNRTFVDSEWHFDNLCGWSIRTLHKPEFYSCNDLPYVKLLLPLISVMIIDYCLMVYSAIMLCLICLVG